MLFLDGVYVERPDGRLRFRAVKAPTSTELNSLAETLAWHSGRYLERQGLLELDAENSYLSGDEFEAGAIEQMLGSSITYRIAISPQRGPRYSPCRRCRPVRSSLTTGAAKGRVFTTCRGGGQGR